MEHNDTGPRDDLLTVAELNTDFTWTCYVSIWIAIFWSCLIGIYFYFQRQMTRESYFLGDRSFGMVTIGVSLVVSLLSGTSLINYAAEIYQYGAQSTIGIFAIPIYIALAHKFYLPVFYRLGIWTSYEYLELRFNRLLRVVVALFFFIQELSTITLVVSIPARAFSHITSEHEAVAEIMILAMCTFYTLLGGFRAVIWTDCFEFLIMILSVLPPLIDGTDTIGGVSIVLERARDSGRLEFFDFRLDPRIRVTFWSALLGTAFQGLSLYGCNQVCVQRYLASRSENVARAALWLNCALMVFTSALFFSIGFTMYAFYYNCDPVSAKQVSYVDQILPLFVLHMTHATKFIPGLLTAGVFCGSLSSVSSSLNAVTSVLVSDVFECIPSTRFRRSFYGKDIPLARILGIVVACICYFLVSCARSGSMTLIIELGHMVNGILGGSALGLFTLAMFFPYVSSKGAGAGYVVALICTCWCGFARLWTIMNARPGSEWTSPPNLQRGRIDMCPESYIDYMEQLNKDSDLNDGYDPSVFVLHQISSHWLPMIGCLLCLIIGLIVSCFFPHDVGELDPMLIHPDIPGLFRFWPRAVRGQIETYWAGIGIKRRRKCRRKKDMNHVNHEIQKIQMV